jgi:hypothetical protein
VPSLELVFLLVSCLSLMLQVLSYVRLVAQRARNDAEEIAGGGYTRTVLCRVLAATVYVVVAAVQLAGDGSLTPEALIVFSSIQVLWQLNSLQDIRVKRQLGELRGDHVQ